jgi:hypothetical protein
MSLNQWAAFATLTSILAAGMAFAIKWTVKHYLSELKPNSGSSMNDRLTRVERMLEIIIEKI